MAILITTKLILSVDNTIGHTLVDGREVLSIRSINHGNLGCSTKGDVLVPAGVFIAYHLGEAEVIGVGTLKVNGLRSCHKVAEGSHIATNGKAQHLDICRAQAWKVGVFIATTEVDVGVCHDATEALGVDYAAEGEEDAE